MRTIVISDVHGSPLWKKVLEKEKEWDRVIFLGDYFDTYDNISPLQQMGNFKEIIEFKRSRPLWQRQRVSLLIGNHDTAYIAGGCRMGGTASGGDFIMIFSEMRALILQLQIAESFENYLFTHAGVTETFMNRNCSSWDAPNIKQLLHEQWMWKPRSFFAGNLNDQKDTPLWVRPKELQKGSEELADSGLIQVVGHTPQSSLVTEGPCIFADTLLSSGEYLIIDDGLHVGKI